MFSPGNPLRILLIEDNVAEARLLEELLKEVEQLETKLVHATRLQTALENLLTTDFDLALLDLTLPDSQGIASVQTFSQAAPQLPLIVLTNLDDEDLALEALRQGAQDYLNKRQINPALLARTFRHSIERKQILGALNQARAQLELRVEQRTAELAQTQQFAQVTLNSISDAVITTDITERIELLNPAAERLTGWTQAQAQGRQLQEVVQFIDESTHQPVNNLVEQTLKQEDHVNNYHANTLSLLLNNIQTQKSVAVELSIAPITIDQVSSRGMVLVCRDVTSTRGLARQLSWQASHDPLTGLMNRREFEHWLQEAVFEVKSSPCSYVLCYLDLDQFKVINDTCGHTAGDELLRQVSHELQSQLGPKDRLARLGGDEFGLLLHDRSLAEAQGIAQIIVESLSNFQFIWQNKLFKIGVSIGLVSIDTKVGSKEDLLSAADAAMYAAKDQGGNRYHGYHPDDYELVKRRRDMQWVSRIQTALEQNRFCLYVQEIRSIQSHRFGQPFYEVLLRLLDDAGNVICPGTFIPAAERYNLMPHLDRWVIRTLFQQLKSKFNPYNLLDNPSKFPCYSINLSGASFNDSSFLHFVKQQFLTHQICPEQICFEITETAAITHLKKAVKFIEELKQLGCRFALDDFGSGMSSLTYLKTLPVDYLKIDGQLIKPIANDPVAMAMIEAIVHISKAMGLQTIAEFVESEEVLDQVQTLGINYVQGYAIGYPNPLQTIEQANLVELTYPLTRLQTA
jgi:diguanylate cyclase (GGDEF)-like protein/PAS domain S-box-containing protein